METQLISVQINREIMDKLCVMAKQNGHTVHDEIVIIIENMLPKLNE